MEAERNTDGILFKTVAVVLLLSRDFRLRSRVASVETAATQARNPNTTPMVIRLRNLSLWIKMGYTRRSSMRIVRTAVRSEMVLVVHVKGNDSSFTWTTLPLTLAQKEKDLLGSISNLGMFNLLTWGTNAVVSYEQEKDRGIDTAYGLVVWNGHCQ